MILEEEEKCIPKKEYSKIDIWLCHHPLIGKGVPDEESTDKELYKWMSIEPKMFGELTSEEDTEDESEDEDTSKVYLGSPLDSEECDEEVGHSLPS